MKDRQVSHGVFNMVDMLVYVTSFPRDLQPNWQPKRLIPMDDKRLSYISRFEPGVPTRMMPTLLL